MHIESLKDKQYEVSERTFSMKKANGLGIIMIIPIAAVLLFIYHRVMPSSLEYSAVFVIAAFFAGIVVHEFIHGFVWHFSCEDKWKSIKFGIDKKTLSPYTACREVIPINAYKIGVIMPAVVTGVIPFIIGLVIKNASLAYVGILLICTAVGDMMILCTIFNADKNSFVEDHPTLCGCIVYKEIK